MRVYLPETFIRDARECDPSMDELWQRVEALPRVRRGAGWGRMVELTPAEADAIAREAAYRAEYWLTDTYGVESVSASERSAGLAAARVRDALGVI